MTHTSLDSKSIVQRPINRFSELDNESLQVLVLPSASALEIAKVAEITQELAEQIVTLRNRQGLITHTDLYAVAGVNRRTVECLRRKSLLNGDEHIFITDVLPSNGKIMSWQPFTLRILFAAEDNAKPVLASINVEWAGERFTIEQQITAGDHCAGYVDIVFDKDHVLPGGLVVFRAVLATEKGAQATFRITCVVLPSNPFSLALSPNANLVTGTFSARGIRIGNTYDTSVGVILSNGDNTAINVFSQFSWKFWDGGVGNSLVEQGTGNFGDSISVPSFGTWGGWIKFHSPQGSPIFDKYNGKEDMTIEIVMTRSNDVTISGTITARTMFQFGVNVTEVAFEDFTTQENSDLNAAAVVTRTIYERHDITFITDNRGIERSRAGSFETITSDSEARDLWEQWSGPDTNNNIDVFVVNQLSIDGKYDGLDGDIPGPTSHAGRSSGTVQNKSGFVDSSGTRRLHVEYLGMLMGHELGHYLGLPHTDDMGNLMLPSSGVTDTNLTYDQYRTVIQHGWVSID